MINLQEALAQPIDSFETYFNDETRYYFFEDITSTVNSQISQLKYIIVCKEMVNDHPKSGVGSFEPGFFKGKLLVYQYDNEYLIAIVEVNASSSSVVTITYDGSLRNPIMEDYLNNVNMAIKEALESNFTVIGSPSKLQPLR